MTFIDSIADLGFGLALYDLCRLLSWGIWFKGHICQSFQLSIFGKGPNYVQGPVTLDLQGFQPTTHQQTSSLGVPVASRLQHSGYIIVISTVVFHPWYKESLDCISLRKSTLFIQRYKGLHLNVVLCISNLYFICTLESYLHYNHIYITTWFSYEKLW